MPPESTHILMAFPLNVGVHLEFKGENASASRARADAHLTTTEMDKIVKAAQRNIANKLLPKLLSQSLTRTGVNTNHAAYTFLFDEESSKQRR